MIGILLTGAVACFAFAAGIGIDWPGKPRVVRNVCCALGFLCIVLALLLEAR